MYNDYFDVRDRYLEHYGVKGMKWKFSKFLKKVRRGGRDVYSYATNAVNTGRKYLGNTISKARQLAYDTGYRVRNSDAYGRAMKYARKLKNRVNRTASLAGHYIKAKYNPGALYRRAGRSVNNAITYLRTRAKSSNSLFNKAKKTANLAGHYVKAKYNPVALTSRYNRSKSIDDLVKATKAHSNAGGVNKYGTKSYNINYDLKNGKLVQTGKTLTGRTNAFGTNDDAARRKGLSNQFKSMTGRFVTKKKKSRW